MVDILYISLDKRPCMCMKAIPSSMSNVTWSKIYVVCVESDEVRPRSSLTAQGCSSMSPCHHVTMLVEIVAALGRRRPPKPSRPPYYILCCKQVVGKLAQKVVQAAKETGSVKHCVLVTAQDTPGKVTQRSYGLESSRLDTLPVRLSIEREAPSKRFRRTFSAIIGAPFHRFLERLGRTLAQ